MFSRGKLGERLNTRILLGTFCFEFFNPFSSKMNLNCMKWTNITKKGQNTSWHSRNYSEKKCNLKKRHGRRPPSPPLVENVIHCFFGSFPTVEFQLIVPSYLLNPTYAIEITKMMQFIGSATVPA